MAYPKLENMQWLHKNIVWGLLGRTSLATFFARHQAFQQG